MLFKKACSKARGRAQGSRSKISQASQEALHTEGEQHGASALKIMRFEDPADLFT